MKHKITSLLLVISLAFLCSCSLTKMTGVWKNPAYEGTKFRKVLVIGISEKDLHRRMLEDQLSGQLRLMGVEAVQSYNHFSEDELKDNKKVSSRLQSMGFDAMLISQMVGQRIESFIQPGRTYVRSDNYTPHMYQKGWHRYYTDSYEITHEPPYEVRYRVVTVETNLYETATDKLIWGAISDTEVSDNLESSLRSYISVLSKNLAKANLF